MLISDSMALLWLTYALLSLVVLLTGYLGLAFLSRLPRLVITWSVAGVMWMPSRFRLPLLEEGEYYTGLAPAVVVAAIAFLERNASSLVLAGLLVLVGALAGSVVGGLLWWRGRQRNEPANTADEDRSASLSRGRRREPKIG